MTLLAHASGFEPLSLHGVVVLLAVGGLFAAAFGKTLPAMICYGVALVLIVL